MAKLVGLVGSIVQKSGNFVFSTWKGIQVMRVYNPNKSKPRSQKQISQSEKFLFASQYSIAMSKTTYLKHIWKLITPFRKQSYNMFLKLNLENAAFESDNTLCPNHLIINNNHDDLQTLIFSDQLSCKDGIWKLDGLDLAGCGIEPDGVLLIQVFQSNLLSDPDLSPFKDCRICESYSQELSWPILALTNLPYYEDVFDICCPECPAPGTECCNSTLWVIPVFSAGLDASFDPSLITKAGSPILACFASVTDDPYYSENCGVSYYNQIFVSILSATVGANVHYVYRFARSDGVPATPPDPTAADALWTSPIRVRALGSTTNWYFKAIAIKDGISSNVISCRFRIIY